MPMSIGSSIVLTDGAVWLDPRTPQNFNAGRNLPQARLIGLRASVYSRQRKTLTSAQLNVHSSDAQAESSSPVGRRTGFVVLKRDWETDNRLVVRSTSRHLKHSGGNSRTHGQERDDDSVHTPSPGTVLRYGGSDPFHSLPLHLTARKYNVLRTATLFSTSATFPAEMHSNSVRRIYDNGMNRIFHDFLIDEAGSQALICFSWSVMARLSPMNMNMCRTRCFKHGAKAIETLRPTIAWLNQDSEELKKVLRTVHVLCATAVFLGDRAAAMYHQDALKRLVGLIGGLHQLPALYQSLIVYLIVRIALNTRTRTVLEPREWDPVVLPVIEEPDISATTTSTTSGLCEPWNRVFVNLKELALVERSAGQDIDLLRWCFFRRQAIKARVGNLWCDFADPMEATEPVLGITAVPTLVYKSSLDMCLCLAVQNYIIVTSEPTTLTQQTIASTQIFHVMLIRCLAKLEVEFEQIPSSYARARDLLWVFGVGAVVEIQLSSQAVSSVPWINCQLDELESSWFMLRFGVLVRRLGCRRYEDFVRLFEEDYVYSESVQGQILRRSFDSAVGLSEHRVKGI